MESLLQDLRYTARTLRRSPGFTAVAVLILALGIGGNSAIFSVVDAVLFRPLPYDEPDRLVRVLHNGPEDGFAVTPGSFSPQDFEDLERDERVYESLAAYYFVPGQSETILVGEGAPEELETAFVSSDFFGTLGVVTALGSTPPPEQHVAGADRVIVLSHGFWSRRFGSDRGVLGRTVSLDGEPFSIIGVMPPTFDYPAPEVEVWVPLSLIEDDDIPHIRSLRWMEVIGRLEPTTTLAAAAAGTNTILRRLEEAYPETNEGWGSASVITLQESLVGDVRPALLVLFGTVALVLLLACVNLSNLLLARGAARARELAVRTALGAGRSRVIRQLLTESVVVALIGGVGGLLLAFWGVEALVALSAGTLPRPETIDVDSRIFGFTLGITVITGLFVGLVPALRASRVELTGALKSGERGGGEGRHSDRTRALLIGAEMALAVVMLAGAGLMIRSFWNLTRVDPGFAGENVLVLSVSTPSEVLDSDRRSAYRQEMISRIENLPGVVAVGGSKTIPLHGGGEPYSFSIPGRTDASEVTPESGVFIITHDYFEALGIPLLKGRVFTDADESAQAFVLMVNAAFARRYWPGEDAVGRTLAFGDMELPIVGVVGNVRTDEITQAPQPAVYVPSYIMARSSMKLFVRTAADPMRVADLVRHAIWEVNPNQPISDVTTMRQVVSETVAQPRFLTLVLGIFAGLAIALAAFGVYGVLAFAVSRRTHEIGIRMALGAAKDDVLRLIVTQGMVPAVGGLAVGIVAAFGLTRLLSGLLYGIGAVDPATFAGVSILLLVVALLAIYVPARRAAAVNPLIALRAE
ncbi:MAG: ABC transporter permease [Longimicrobiales bacterium]